MNRAEPKVLIACEYSGCVREAFLDLGYDAWSCDLLDSEDNSPRHFTCDVRLILQADWDLIIVAHPPCTRLCNSGVRWLSKPPAGKTLEQMWDELAEGADLFSEFLNSNCPRIAIENPVMHPHAKKAIRGYTEFTQSIQPYQYGHDESKRTCLWLKGLPKLEQTDFIDPDYEKYPPTFYKSGKKKGKKSSAGGYSQRVHKATPGKDRWKERSKFFSGVAAAMATQWGQHADRELSLAA